MSQPSFFLCLAHPILEMMFTLEVGTKLKIVLWINDVMVSTGGVVVTRDLQVGNGIECGIEAARQIKKVSPKSRIIFLSQHDSLHMVMEDSRQVATDTLRRGMLPTTLLKPFRTYSKGSRS